MSRFTGCKSSKGDVFSPHVPWEVFQEMFLLKLIVVYPRQKKSTHKKKYGEFPVVFVDLSLSRVNITIHPEE